MNVQRIKLPTDEELTIKRYKYALICVCFCFVLTLIGSIIFISSNYIHTNDVKDCTCIEDVPNIVFDNDVNDIPYILDLDKQTQ